MKTANSELGLVDWPWPGLLPWLASIATALSKTSASCRGATKQAAIRALMVVVKRGKPAMIGGMAGHGLWCCLPLSGVRH